VENPNTFIKDFFSIKFNYAGRSRRKWEDNIRMDLGKIGWGGMNWIDLVQNMN
jgi:hypothetical protein